MTTKMFFTSKGLIIAFPMIVAIVTAVFFMEDRYFNESQAEEMRVDIETAAVDTFKSFQRDLDLRLLYDLRDKQAILNQLLQRNPTDTYLQMRRQEIIRQIQRLEGKLNGR